MSRPPGSGIRWTPEWDRDIWARVEAIRHQTGLDVRNACRRLAHTGYFQVKDGKAWITRPPTAADHSPVHVVCEAVKVGRLRVGDARDEGPAEQFRTRYYQAQRRQKKDTAYRAECKLWLRIYIRINNGVDPVEAFLAEPLLT